MKKKKIPLILDFEETSDDSNPNYILGLISSLSHLQMAHFLNKTGYFNFEKVDEIEINHKQDKALFICYENQENESGNKYKLIKNKGIGAQEIQKTKSSVSLYNESKSFGILSKELKQIDYILILDSENIEPIHTISDILKTQNFIQMVVEIESSNLSEKTKKIINF